jgi:phosphatidylinositol alpha-1,6-mannosyltransferase
MAPAGIEQVKPRYGRIAYASAALRTVLGRPVDIVFCGHLYMAPLAVMVARLARARLIVQMHGIEAWPRPTRLRRAAVEAADLILCVSRHTRARVLSWATVEPERVVVLPNTVSGAFTPGDGSYLRTRMGLDGKRVLLTVARMDARQRYKGQDRVIQALPQLVAGGHDVIHLVIGDGDDAARLKSLAASLGVADRVRFMGAVDSDALVEAYRMADLFLMPSTGEGFGIVFLEAMASGTPALGLSVAGARDALGDGQLGTSASEGELVAAIARLLNLPRPDPDELAERVRVRFGQPAFAAGVRQIALSLGPAPSSLAGR